MPDRDRDGPPPDRPMRALPDTGSRSGLDRRGPARHELPAVDEAGLLAGRLGRGDDPIRVATGDQAGLVDGRELVAGRSAPIQARP
jgi:hypothetical protein